MNGRSVEIVQYMLTEPLIRLYMYGGFEVTPSVCPLVYQLSPQTSAVVLSEDNVIEIYSDNLDDGESDVTYTLTALVKDSKNLVVP